MTVALALGVVLVLASPGIAAPVPWTHNGHYYDLVDDPLGATWLDAKADAASRVFMGVSGHLATITSQGEQDFIVSALLSSTTTHLYALGAYQAEGSQEPDGGWQWVTGEAWGYTNWNAGEPNNTSSAGEEWTLQVYANSTFRGLWNDAHGAFPGSTGYDYVVEYPVPGPATISLLAIGGMLLLRRRPASTHVAAGPS